MSKISISLVGIVGRIACCPSMVDSSASCASAMHDVNLIPTSGYGLFAVLMDQASRPTYAYINRFTSEHLSRTLITYTVLMGGRDY